MRFFSRRQGSPETSQTQESAGSQRNDPFWDDTTTVDLPYEPIAFEHGLTTTYCRRLANAYQQRVKDLIGSIRWSREAGHFVSGYQLAELRSARLEAKRYRRLIRQRMAMISYLNAQGFPITLED